MKNFTFTRPDCLAEALKVKERGGVKAHVLAGGTNLMSYIKKGVFTEGALIDITRLDELKAVARSGDTLEIGACATITELLENPLVTGTVPFFAGALRKFANPLIRNTATIGGNLADASPIADTAPILLVLDAVLTARSISGSREIPLADFFVAPRKTVLRPEELLTRIAFRIPEKTETVTFLKMGLRNGTACSVTSAAAFLGIENGKAKTVRVALGGVAPRPVRARAAEAALSGKDPTMAACAASAEHARADISPISDVRGSAEYRSDLAVTLVKRCLALCAGLEV